MTAATFSPAAAPTPADSPHAGFVPPEVFEALAQAALVWRELTQAMREAFRLPIDDAQQDRTMRGVSIALQERVKAIPGYSDDELLAWSARGAAMAASASVLALNALAELHDRAAGRAAKVAAPVLVAADGHTPLRAGATNLVGPDLRPVAPPPAPAAAGLGRLEAAAWVHPAATPAEPYTEPTCRHCGCTERNPCRLLHPDPETPGGRPVLVGTCGWEDLDPTTNAGVCSACME